MEQDLKLYGTDFQFGALHLLIKDSSFFKKVRSLIEPLYFENRYAQWFVKYLIDYSNTYNRAPSIEILKTEISKQFKGPVLKVYQEHLKQIEESKLEHHQYIEKEFFDFCFKRHLTLKIEKLEEFVKEGDFEAGHKLMFEAFKPLSSNIEVFSLVKDYPKATLEDEHNPVPSPIGWFNEISKGGPGEGDLALVIAPSNFGKCFKKGTKVLMFDGTIKNIEDLKEGNLIMGPDNKQRTVVNLIRGEEQMYSVKQSDNTEYTVNESHLLVLKSPSEEVIISVRDYMKKTSGWKEQHKGVKASLVDFPSNEIMLDPYKLGFFNENIVELNPNKFGLKINSDIIPIPSLDHFFINHSTIRFQLLAGIIDKCGVYIENGAVISLTNFLLKDKISFLTRSLGFKTIVEENKITIIGDVYDIPTKNKTKHPEGYINNKDFLNVSIQVESVGHGEYYGISLKEENKKFLLADFTVVHNSTFLVACARAAFTANKRAVFFSFETKNIQLVRKALAGLVEKNQEELSTSFSDIEKSVTKFAKNGADIRFYHLKTFDAYPERIASILEELKAEGFFADMVAVDSLNQLKLPKGSGVDKANTNAKFEYLAEVLRDMAGVYSIPFWASLQTNRCLSLDTLVESEERGVIRLGTIKEGEKIKTLNSFQTVSRVYPIEKQMMYKIKTKSGKEIEVSAKHLFPTEDGTFLSIETGLQVGSKLLTKKQ